MQIVIDMPNENYQVTLTKIMLACRGCSITELPKGHGRLIDADAIPEQIELKGFLSQDNAHLVTIDRVKEALDNVSTIIEAESEGLI